MIGILIVSHRQLGDALIDCAEFILNERPQALAAVSIDLRENAAPAAECPAADRSY